ncbi:hypothetical protein Tco_1465746 [Tanacetum coccineum]
MPFGAGRDCPFEVLSVFSNFLPAFVTRVPRFLHPASFNMGLLDFIKTADPRKVWAMEVQKGDDQVTLLESKTLAGLEQIMRQVSFVVREQSATPLLLTPLEKVKALEIYLPKREPLDPAILVEWYDIRIIKSISGTYECDGRYLPLPPQPSQGKVAAVVNRDLLRLLSSMSRKGVGEERSEYPQLKSQVGGKKMADETVEVTTTQKRPMSSPCLTLCHSFEPPLDLLLRCSSLRVGFKDLNTRNDNSEQSGERNFIPLYLTFLTEGVAPDHGIQLVSYMCLKSSEYLMAFLWSRFGRASDFGNARCLEVPVLSMASARRDAGMDEVLDYFLLDGPLAELPEAASLQPCIEELSIPIHHAGDKTAIGETSLSFALMNVHARAEGAKKHAAALRQLMMEIVSAPLSSQTWVGEASISAAPLSVEGYAEEDTDESLRSVVAAPHLERCCL